MENSTDLLKKEMDHALGIITHCESSIRVKYVFKLRKELYDKIGSLEMCENRKSYFEHQTLNALSIEELIILVKAMNQKQEKEQVFLTGSLKWISFSPISA